MPQAQRALSSREIRSQAIALQRQTSLPVVLYYGSLEENDSITASAFGNRYTIPADSPAWDPETGEPIARTGTVEIRDIMGVGEFVRPKEGEPWPEKDKLMHRASDIAAKLQEQLQKRGVVALSGDPERDARIKAEATTKWVAWRNDSAQRTIMAFNAANEAKAKLGGEPDAMPDHVIAAERFQEARLSGVYAAHSAVDQRYGFRCREAKCMRVENDAAKFRLHLKIKHQLSDAEIVTRYSEDEEVVVAAGDAMADTPVKRGPGRPRKTA